MKLVKYFLSLFTIMFTTTNITFCIFDFILSSDTSFFDATIQSIGLAFIFCLVMISLDILSNYIKILNSKYYMYIQYLILLFIIVSWAKYFKWGNWNDIRYSFIFILSFSVIYLFIYMFFNVRYKKEDENLSKLLSDYQNEIKL